MTVTGHFRMSDLLPVERSFLRLLLDFLQPAVGQKGLLLFYVTSQACSSWVAVDTHRSV